MLGQKFTIFSRPQAAHLFAGALLVGLTVLTAPGAASAGDPIPPVPGGDASTVAPRFGAWGLDLSGRDVSVRPGDNFFRYANGGWFDRVTIPPDRSSIGTFDKLPEVSDNRVRRIVESAVAGRLATPDAVRIAAAYRAYMDDTAIERADLRPVAADLAAIRAVRDKTAMAGLMGQASRGAMVSMFDAYISPDAKNPQAYAVYLGQAPLGLPERSYYLDARFADKQAKYQAYVARVLEMIGWATPQDAARSVVALETDLAQASWSLADWRNVDRTYNPTTPKALARSAPEFPWAPYFANAGLGQVHRLVATTDTAIPRISAVFGATPLDTLKAWEAFRMVDRRAGLLSRRFADAQFDFREKELSGQLEPSPRWRRAMALVTAMMPHAIGRLYVAEYFPPEAKTKIDALVDDIRLAMRARIEKAEWMAPTTRAQALDKLSKLSVQVGYPSAWKDYSGLVVKADDPVGNARRAAAFEWQRSLARLNRPVDRAESTMTPQKASARYVPAKNQIMFSAAILQPPFFDPDADPAVNFGGIGTVIGHEITHGFDDQGRKMDGDGVLRNWWAPGDAAKFEASAKRLDAQYSAFEVLPGVHVKGAQTLGEDIADQGGLLLALDAYRISLHGKPAPVVDGLTGEQRVFLGFAQVFREKFRDGALADEVMSDVHAPSSVRVIATVRNVDAWYEAFGVKPGDAYYLPPEDRVRLW